MGCLCSDSCADSTSNEQSKTAKHHHPMSKLKQSGSELVAVPSEKLNEALKIQKAIRRHIIQQCKDSLSWKSIRENLVRGAPLFAALVAPVSTLYDIPALTQHWYTFNGTELPDPAPNLALSALGLAFNVVANGLLVFRFSARPNWWKSAMITSTICWILKTIIAVVNLSVYGGRFTGQAGYAYTSAFWCGGISCILAGVIASALVVYVIVAGIENRSDSEETRVQGRHFMLGELGLFCTLAIEALIFSKIEGWHYFDGIYFSLVVALTIGYGDFSPTHASTKVLLFPFAILTVAFLASQVSMIVRFFSDNASARRLKWRELYEHKREQGYKENINLDEELVEEMEFLKRLVDQEERMSRFLDLGISLFGFICFWMLGAVVYTAVEDWSFGNSVYYCYVTFFTIGFGDFSPSTPGGQAFFIIYALVAVPLIASFAVQTITSIWTAFQSKRLEKEKVKRGVEPGVARDTTLTVTLHDEEVDLQPFTSHAEMVIKCHQKLGHSAHQSPLKRRKDSHHPSSDDDVDIFAEEVDKAEAEDEDTLDKAPNSERISKAHKLERELVDNLLAQVIEMEGRARGMLVKRYEHGSKARLLLQADKNLMDRAQGLIEKESQAGNDDHTGQTLSTADSLSDLEEIQQAFARILVYGTRLKRLQGYEQLMFERRRGDPYCDGEPVEQD